MKVFLSYHPDEKAWVDRFCDTLVALDVEFIHPNASWDGKALGAQLSQTNATVVFLSAAYLTAKKVKESLPLILSHSRDSGSEVLALVVKSCPWRGVPLLAGLQVIPADGSALMHDNLEIEAQNLDEARNALLDIDPTTRDLAIIQELEQISSESFSGDMGNDWFLSEGNEYGLNSLNRIERLNTDQ